jgi:hypothetical protein
LEVTTFTLRRYLYRFIKDFLQSKLLHEKQYEVYRVARKSLRISWRLLLGNLKDARGLHIQHIKHRRLTEKYKTLPFRH